MEIKCEDGDVAFVECKFPSNPDGLNGSLIFVYRKGRQVRAGPFGTLLATRMHFRREDSFQDHSEACTDATAEPQTTTDPPKMPSKRRGLNWSEDELHEWMHYIAWTIRAATASLRDPTAANTEARRMAAEHINGLPQPLRKLLRTNFEKSKWKQVLK
jgi:hypothetical protein